MTVRWLVMLVLGVVLAGCQSIPPLDTDTAAGLPPTPVSVAPGGDALAQLQVRAEDTGAHYDRDDWGVWADHARGCDTRELVLFEQGRNLQRGKGCHPLCPTGMTCWTSPYDNVMLADRETVHVDHVVALREATRSGARHWDGGTRRRFANDPSNLLAVSAAVNMSKGDRDPGRWKPPQPASWCLYATRYTTVKAKYELHVDPAEHAELAAMLWTC